MMSWSSRGWLVLSTAFLCSAGLARADTVTLKNGREIHGRLVEEGEHSIQIRTAGGTITISKAEVATFSENENWGSYAPTRRAEGATAPREVPAPEEPGATSPDAAVPAPPSPQGWKWAPGVTVEQQAALTPVRDRTLGELAALAPSAEERLAAIALSADEERELREQIGLFDWRRRQTTANLMRRNAMEGVVDTFGVKAIPRLVDSLGSPSHWTARISVQALERLAARAADKAEVQWLLYHHDAPEGLVRLMDHQGEVDSPFIRQEANQALEAITGRAVGYQPSPEALRTPAETEAFRAWRDWWQRERTRWTREEKERNELRASLEDKLEAIRAGRDPDDAS